MKLLKNELIKSKIFLFIIVDICIQILVILAIKTYILDISAPYSELDYNKYWYVLHTLIYMPMIFPIQILYQNLREALIEDNNNGWNIMVINTNNLVKIIYIKVTINIVRCFICYFVYTIFSLIQLGGMGTDMLLTNIIFPNIMSFLLFLPIAIFMQICCIRFDSILAKALPNILLILIVLITFQSDWNIFIPETYYYTEIQSTTNLGIKLLVCIWIMGFEFSLLPKLIKLKEQNLV
ncbi:putative membrane protein [Streptococcus pneumoniae 2072047]|nr:putative membrane protein [Streptococcus pneumoniae 2072047]